MRPALLGAWAVVLLAAGCGSDFRPASLVNRSRLVGIRLDVEDGSDRAEPAFGETFTATPLIVAPDGASPLTSAFFACALLPSRSGVPACAGAPLAAGMPVPGTAPPMRVSVPAELAAQGITSVLLAIATCDDGAVPRLGESGDTSSLPTCEGGGADARAELSIFTVPLTASPATANRHPNLEDETTTLSDPGGTTRAWAPSTSPPPSGGCAGLADGDSLPHVRRPPPRAVGELDEDELVWTLSITSSSDDRERYQRVVPGGEPPMDTREALQISHYLTAGTLARQFSAIEGLEDTVEPSAIEWTLPEASDIPPEGLVVRFWWVARDLRGGMTITERALCVLPS